MVGTDTIGTQSQRADCTMFRIGKLSEAEFTELENEQNFDLNNSAHSLIL